jgi:ArsR family transcriptional regulator
MRISIYKFFLFLPLFVDTILAGVMATKNLSDQALQLIGRRFKALSEPMRLRLVMSLMGGAKNVGELVEVTGASQANVSRHLQTLTDSGILTREKKGLFVYYQIADRSVFELCDLVCGRVEEYLRGQARAFD